MYICLPVVEDISQEKRDILTQPKPSRDDSVRLRTYDTRHGKHGKIQYKFWEIITMGYRVDPVGSRLTGLLLSNLAL